MKLALISDIHGNSWALEKVFQDIGSRQPDIILNLGDSLYGPLDPAGTFELLCSYDIIHISGNEDRVILENFKDKSSNETLNFVREQLNQDSLSWLRSLHQTTTIEDKFYLCHGTPASDSQYLLQRIVNGNIELNNIETIQDLLQDINQKIIFCGHSHFPGVVNTPEYLIINPGSVGLQAYEDDIPVMHKVENNSPFARYSLIEITPDDVKVEQHMISYDFEKAARCAEKNYRSDWAKWLRTGCV